MNLPISENECDEKKVYDQAFWLCYLANILLVAANGLTFRFADLIAWLGETEATTGYIVGAGMVGALFARLFLGQAIDHYGAVKLWILGAVTFLLGCSTFIWVWEVNWIVFSGRIAFQIGIAGMFTSSIVFIQNRVPSHRRTEVIGNLGSSGFLGMVSGAGLSDFIFSRVAEGRLRYEILFGTAVVFGVAYLVLVLFAARNSSHQRPKKTHPITKLIFRYWPGNVVWVAMTMGLVFSVTTVFLSRLVDARGMNGIGPFFLGYTISAFSFRILSRNWSKSIGRHSMILLGLSGHIVGLMSISFATQTWHLVFPSICSGFGHALLFPAVVSLGSGAYPLQFRGSGTTIVLGFFEVGAMVFSPLLGSIIHHFGFQTMYWTAAGIVTVVTLIYAVMDGRKPDDDHDDLQFEEEDARQHQLASSREFETTEACGESVVEESNLTTPAVKSCRLEDR